MSGIEGGHTGRYNSRRLGGCAALPFDRYTVEEADHERYRCGSDPGRLRRRLAYGYQEGAYAPTVGPYGEGPSLIGTAHPPLQAHLCID